MRWGVKSRVAADGTIVAGATAPAGRGGGGGGGGGACGMGGALGPAGGGPAAAAGAPWCPLGRPARTRASRRRRGSRWAAAVSDLRRARRRIGTFLRFRSSSSRRARVSLPSRRRRRRTATYSARGWYLARGGARSKAPPASLSRSAIAASCAGVAESRSQSPSAKVWRGDASSGALFGVVAVAAAPPSTCGAWSAPGAPRRRLRERPRRGVDSGFQRLHLLHALHHLRLVRPARLRASRSRDASWSSRLCFLIVSATRLVYAKSTRNSSCQFSSSRYTAASRARRTPRS